MPSMKTDTSPGYETTGDRKAGSRRRGVEDMSDQLKTRFVLGLAIAAGMVLTAMAIASSMM